MFDLLNDPLFLLFMLTAAVVAAGTIVCVIAIFARNGNDAELQRERVSTLDFYFKMLKVRDNRITQLDEDYKALVESYLRETGKVYVRPARAADEQLHPPQPNPFRMKPPPWSLDDSQKGQNR